VDPLVWEGDVPELRSPVLVCAFRGWNDAAASASTALETIAGTLDSELLAELDPEEFFDFQANRPTITLTDGQTRHIEWPSNQLVASHAPGAERDLVLLDGTEPNLRWRTFADLFADAAERLGVELVVTLGALIAEVAHTMPVPITGLASDEDLVERLDLQRSNYEGPTGIVGVLHTACAGADLPSVSLWAAVPHYVAAAPNPKAALALVRKFEGVSGMVVEASELEEAAEDYERQVSAAVASDDDVKAFVEKLETAADEADADEPPEDIPSADTIARDFQRFLRQRGPEHS
jgi:proteasome assembly chaperone (PAC2) family protein